MTAEYIRDWQQPRHAVGREGTGIPVPESALSSWLDAYRAENERRQEMADAAFSATPLGNLINKSLDAQEKQDKTITLAGDARKQARGAVDEAMASLRLLPSYLRDPLIRHLSFLRKKQEADRRKGKKSWQAERYARGTLRKIFERLDRTDHRWLTPGYRSLAGRERLDDLLYLPQLNQYQIQTLATMTAAMFSSTFEKLCDGFGATDGELTMDVTLKAYQMLARMALHLHAMPPHYEALNKSDPDTELLPGAILRLTCAEWWKRKLWLLRCEWREEQLRAACLVSRKTSPYLSQDALSEFRAQREKTRDFLKSFILENEDGFTIDLETVYYAGVSNPVHRKAEMMATMKGLELLAEARGDKAVFLTITCPSKYHATTENGHPNPKWNG
ncbi:replication endonuclease, partial [Escherichia coli]|nr:replication endonuclease [Escherichia coli]EEZ3594727.1 replication endonuclease [Escherichia coli]